MKTRPLGTFAAGDRPRLLKTALSGKFVVIRGRARWDVDTDVRAFEANTIQRVLASLVANAERDGLPEAVAWLKNRVVNGQSWDMLKSRPPTGQPEADP